MNWARATVGIGGKWMRLAAIGVGLLAVWPRSVGAAEASSKPVGTAKWEPEIRAFEAADQTNVPPREAILFVGSSSIRRWKTLAQDFPEYQVINRGFGGSQIIDAVYFADRIVTPYRPRLIVLYAGANDINAGKTPEQVFGDFCAFVAKVGAMLPQTRIAYLSIAGNPARWKQVERVREANRRIQRFCDAQERLVYIDVFSHMLGPDALPKPDIFVEDQLHMNAKGYAIWKDLIQQHLVIPQSEPAG